MTDWFNLMADWFIDILTNLIYSIKSIWFALGDVTDQVTDWFPQVIQDSLLCSILFRCTRNVHTIIYSYMMETLTVVHFLGRSVARPRPIEYLHGQAR